VVHRLARENGWFAISVKDLDDPDRSVDLSRWVLVTRNQAFLSQPELTARLEAAPMEGPLWTDDFSSILPLLRALR
jgi:hypothetical protein